MGRSALEFLEKYEGKNPYLKKLRNDYLQNRRVKLTETQIKYIIDNHQKEPILINKLVRITSYLGEELQKQEELPFIPEKILIEYILADTEKTYHIYGKVKKNQKQSGMYFLPKTQVLDDPYFEEINVDVNFDPYNKILEKFDKSLYQHQETGVKFLIPRNGAILADDMGLGKMEFVDNKLFTPTGRKRIGDIKTGDQVIGSNGLPCNVVGVYPQGKKKLYRVTFNDGYSVLVGEEHLWSVTRSKGRTKGQTLSTGQMLDENLYLEERGVGHNKDKIYKYRTHYKQKNGNLSWKIPIVKSIEFSNENELPIEPYLLGLCLGDGHVRDSTVTFTIHKDDFYEMFEGIELTERKNKRKNLKIANIKFGDTLKELNLANTRSHTKFIPEIYKYSSIGDRVAILQGLMDTDGHCLIGKNTNNFHGTEYCSVSEQLTDDLAEIVHSLGGITRKSSKMGAYSKNGIKVICKRVYKLNIKMPSGINPFRLKRKANLYNEPQKYKVCRRIKDIKLERVDEAVCIAVDAPDKLYVTEHAIVTHNTTTSIIAALESGCKNILVICPASVKINWKREISIFCKDVAIVDGKEWEYDAWKKYKFTIINFDVLKKYHTVKDKHPNPDELQKELNRHIVNAGFDMLIVDEAHALQNKNSQRGEIVADLALNFGIEKVWLLTGTPVTNRPMNFFNLLRIIKSPIANNWMYFANRYCEARKMFRTLKNGKKKQIFLTDGASNLDELAAKTKNIILRRLKSDTLDMPDRIVTPIYHVLSKSARTEYESLWDEYLLKRKAEKKRGTIERDLVELILLRKFIAMQAIPQTIEMAEELLEQGKKVIIFTTFNDELDELAEHFGKKCVLHNGSMTDKQKQVSVDAFQENKNKTVFIGNIRSAGVGITLTASHYVILNSFEWIPGLNDQAIDRSHRIGIKDDVYAYYQLFEDTISIRMWDVLNSKKSIIDQIMGDNKLSEAEILEKLTDEIINEL